MRRALLVVVAVVAVGGPLQMLRPPPEVVPSPKELKQEGDAFSARREWGRAAESYRQAYSLEDPVPERAKPRAWLAYLRGVALARVPIPLDAGRWFDRALRLDPDLYVVHFERGLLHDGRRPETTDRRTARESFERFLAASEAAGSPAQDRGLVEQARAALETLAD